MAYIAIVKIMSKERDAKITNIVYAVRNNLILKITEIGLIGLSVRVVVELIVVKNHERENVIEKDPNA